MKGVILPLPPINHDAISYPEFTKSFYEEHPDIAQLTAEQVADIRREFSMHVSGREPIPKPCISFAHFGFEESLISAIATQNYSTPTGIQRQALPGKSNI